MRTTLTILALAALAAPTRADESLALTPASINLQPEPPPVATSPTLQEHPENDLPTPQPAIDTRPARAAFGAPRSKWVGIGGGIASNGTDVDLNLYGRYEYFIAQDVEIFGELGAWAYDQEGKDAAGLNTSIAIRYHWIHREKWTMFIDAGIGLLFTNDPVNRSGSDEGTSFNFTPRFGGGYTRELTDDGVRLEIGLRWAHVSNARIGGNNDNPGRDSAMLYAGLIFPF